MNSYNLEEIQQLPRKLWFKVIALAIETMFVVSLSLFDVYLLSTTASNRNNKGNNMQLKQRLVTHINDAG